ncbi:MAG TPA: ABC transporter permease [Streptosporangiaceae bacterium]|nr:ABC transporter permease [Streptosporangiaceae bacterium]
MVTYLVRRAGVSVVVVAGISVLMFGMLHFIFPSPAIVVLGARASLVTVNVWNQQHGFNEPWLLQYWHYLVGALHGNLGFSYKANQTVTSLFAERWQLSAFLTGASLTLAILIAVPLGIYQAVRRNKVDDQIVSSVAFTLYAMPDYLFYLIVIQVFAFWLPVFNYEAAQASTLWGIISDPRDMTLPIVAFALLLVAGYSRYMRSEAIDTLAQDYIKAARAKGLPERLVLLRHLVRNACLPMITLVGLSIPALLAGNLIAEYTFNYQGLGLLFYDSLLNEDYQVLMAYTLLGGILTVAGNFLADIALTVADPRIRLS